MRNRGLSNWLVIGSSSCVSALLLFCSPAVQFPLQLGPRPIEVGFGNESAGLTVPIEVPGEIPNPGMVLLVRDLDLDDQAEVSINGKSYGIPGVAGGLRAKVVIPFSPADLKLGTNQIVFENRNDGGKYTVLDGRIENVTRKSTEVLGVTYRMLARKVIETIETFDFVARYENEFRIDPAEVPEWARRGKVRMYRSGFDLSDVDRMENLLRDGHFNMIQVGWNRGYSWETEAESRCNSAKVIRWCHERGIRVMAYIKASTIRYEDVFKNNPKAKAWVKFDDFGQPITYSTDPGRYHVDTSHPEWIRNILRNVESAIDAGADEIYFDNCQTETHNLMKLFHEVRKLMEDKGGGRTLYCNCKSDLLVDGMCDLSKSESLVVPGVKDGRVVSNVGMYRFYYAGGDGWKPFRSKYGGRIFRGPKGSTKYLLKSGWRRPMAEAAAFQGHFVLAGASSEFFKVVSTGRGNQTILKDWKDICHYNAFFEEFEEYFTEVRSLSKIAVLKPPDLDWENEFFNELGNRNVLYDVVLLPRITPESLKNYSALVVPDIPWVTSDQLETIRVFKESGGRIFVLGSSDSLCNLADMVSPASICRRMDQEEVSSSFMRDLYTLAGEPVIAVSNSQHIVTNLVGKIDGERMVLHVVNYANTPVDNMKITLKLSGIGRLAEAISVRLLSPDEPSTELTQVKRSGDELSFTVPKLDVYSIVVIG